MPDGVKQQIFDIRKQLLILDGYLATELDNHQQQQAAGWLTEEIETKLAQIEKICQNKTPSQLSQPARGLK